MMSYWTQTYWQRTQILPHDVLLNTNILTKDTDLASWCLIEHKHNDKGHRSCLMMSLAVSLWLICCSELLCVTEFSVFLQFAALVVYELNLCLGFYWLLLPFNYSILGVSECLWQHKCWSTEGQITATPVSEHMLVPLLYSFADGL